VPGRMLRRDAVPAEMLDGDPGLDANGPETHAQLGTLIGSKGCLPPAHGLVVRRVPLTQLGDDERASVVIGLDQPSLGPGLEGQRARLPGGELEQPIGPPPPADLSGERGEGTLGGGIDASGDQRPGMLINRWVGYPGALFHWRHCVASPGHASPG